jgi:hypothetical protein
VNIRSEEDLDPEQVLAELGEEAAANVSEAGAGGYYQRGKAEALLLGGFVWWHVVLVQAGPAGGPRGPAG